MLPHQVGFHLQVCFLIFVDWFILFIFTNTFASFFVGYSFGIVDLGIVVSEMREYISSHGGFWFTMRKYHFGLSGRSDLPDVLANSYMDKSDFDRCPQSILFECREIRKRKGFNHSDYPFCVCVAFDRSVGGYIFKRCRSSHIRHAVNLSSIVGHVKFEADLSVEERRQLANFGKIGYTSL